MPKLVVISLRSSLNRLAVVVFERSSLTRVATIGCDRMFKASRSSSAEGGCAAALSMLTDLVVIVQETRQARWRLLYRGESAFSAFAYWKKKKNKKKKKGGGLF